MGSRTPVRDLSHTEQLRNLVYVGVSRFVRASVDAFTRNQPRSYLAYSYEASVRQSMGFCLRKSIHRLIYLHRAQAAWAKAGTALSFACLCASGVEVRDILATLSVRP